MNRLASVFCFLLSAFCLSAKDIYVAQTAQGSGNGTSAANAYAVTWFNTAGNWGSSGSQINPGDTVHLCGTITSALTAQASGTASAQTTIFFEPGANISMPYLPTTGAINLNGYSYITIDGNSNQGWIMASANGSAGPNSVNDTIGVNLGWSDSACIKGVTVQYLTITNMYLLNNASYPSDYSEATGIWMCSWFTNLTIQGCIISQSAGAAGITAAWQGNSDGLTLRSNTITHCNWSIRSWCGASGASLTHRTICYNVIDYMGTEADDSADENHHDGIFLDMPYQGSTVNTYVYGNVIGPHCGAHDTAWLYMSYGAGPTGIVQSNLWVYNNVFQGNFSTSGAPGDGFIYLWGVQGVVANNTCVNVASSASGMGFRFDDSNNVLFLNNIVVGIVGVGCGSSQANLTCDYNFYSSQYFENLINGSGGGTWAQWTAIGGEAHTAFGNPEFVSPSTYNFNLQSGSPCINGSRSNLYSAGVITTDINGVTRASTGNWTMGAYLNGSGSGGVDITIGTQPTSQSAYVGQTATFSVAATGGSTLSYQWQTNGADVSGATSASWTTPSLTTGWSGLSVDVVVTDTAGSLASSTVTLTVTSSGGGGNPATGVHAVAYSANAANITTAAITTQTSGSTILIWIGSGALSEVASKVPTDNKGNTYHSTGANAYVSYPTSGENLYICTNAAGGSGHTFTWPGEAEMESTIMVVEVKNGGRVASVTTNAVGTVSGTQTSAYCANTGPASVVAVWAGDAGATSSSATPNNSFNVLDTQSLASGYVEGVTASKDLSAAGNNDVTWTQNIGQGANMRMVSVQGAASTPAPAAPTQFTAKQVYAKTLTVNTQ
jgi:hypothetical protein